MRKLVLASATATLALAGCATNNAAEPRASSSSPIVAPSISAASADPAATAALGKATAALGTQSFTMTMTAGSGFALTALIDPPAGKGTAELTASGPSTEVTVKSLLIGQDLYAQIPGITKDGTWTHLDMSRLPEGANIGLRPGRIDPVDTANLLASTTDVKATGGNTYSGTVDLTKAAGIAGLDRVTIDGYGAAAQHIPFVAAVDDQGRLATLTLEPPAVQGNQIVPVTATYTDYGRAVAVEQPAATEIIEAPEDVYQVLGG
ncbi:hypothetical protein FB565_005977 [Actinoplanes lutulentus]|uniref:Lipoprotein LprG n=1 Tax=Actinoplanes lutulentus TaxID=1287878 RepID=A0A327Z6T3_9ACTN|nr:hypothetical protein [Actinoplanes lutulentus]MBB2946219.1 hypothetical protein [Actinoplanes lutulentus]RAK32907.1 hypothetical protein B0I29_113204 [Actinoplanes lutulentus]